MRRPVASAAALFCTVGLMAGCGGDAEPLTQDQVSKALLTQDEFPVDGLQRGNQQDGPTGEEDQSALGDDSFIMGDDVPQECKDAAQPFEDAFTKDEPQTVASVDFSGEMSENDFNPKMVTVTVASDWDSAEKALDSLEDIGETCGTVTSKNEAPADDVSPGDPMETKTTYSEFDAPGVDDAEGIQMVFEAAGQKTTMMMVGVEDGPNTTLVFAADITADEVGKILKAQMEKVQKAGE